MRQELKRTITIPEGITCTTTDSKIECKKGEMVSTRKVNEASIDIKIENNEIVLSCNKGNKRHYKIIQSIASHLKNILNGMDNPYEYKLEICNVHFPITAKVDGEKVNITNFLGEKVPRSADILPNVQVQIKGNEVTVSSYDKEAAGQTAANIEKSTKINNRDRRIFQDGLFMTQKAGREIWNL